MCLRNVYYPLLLHSDGTRSISFKNGVRVVDRNSLANVTLKKNLFNNSFKDIGTAEVLKMVQIPCGCCRECLSDISRQWSFRIMKEAQQYSNNFFITLTYDDTHIPSNGMLDKKAISNFNKKLKVYLDRKGLDSDFRFYGVGEYGSQTARPHYHVIYFNLDIPDLKFEYLDENKNLVFSSEFIRSIWNNGHIVIGSVDIGSACYVARYCDKKKRLNKTQKKELLERGFIPEFSVMSRRPGIGSNYLFNAIDRFERGLYQDYINGKSYSMPLYFNKKIKEILEGTEALKIYEDHARVKSAVKLASQIQISDVTDLYSYLNSSDVVKINRKL